MSNQPLSAHTLVALGEFGERARPINNQMREAALIIGLGSIGLQAVARTHDMLESLLPRREFQNNVAILGIARRRTLREELALPYEQRLLLDMEPVDWGDVPGRYATMGVSEWWLQRPRMREMQKNPALTRAYNRLVLFQNAELVGQALYNLAEWLRSVGTESRRSMTRRIYILASLAEAEGSGMLFDVATRLRDLMSQHPTIIMGVFSLYDHSSAEKRENVEVMANTYATLCEIDAYTLHPDIFRSTLPVIGHSLTQANTTPALDMVVLGDETTRSALYTPGSALAEVVTNWVAASLVPRDQAPELPQPVQVQSGTDRFTGYTTFGVSKIALPTRVAMEWAAVNLASQVLKALMALPDVSTATWIEAMQDEAHKAVLNQDVRQAAEVSERLHSWEFDLSSAGLIRNFETRPDRPDTMLELVQGEWRRLEREFVGENSIGQSTLSGISDSIRIRIDTVLALSLRELENTLNIAPVKLSYEQGLGLTWTLSVLEELERRLRARLPEMQRLEDEQKHLYKAARQELFESAQDYDPRSSGRFALARKSPPTDLDARGRGLLDAALELITIQAKLNAWQGLCGTLSLITDRVRGTIPRVNQASEDLEQFEVQAREALRTASRQTEPTFPAAVLVNSGWYVSGTRDLGKVNQLPPRELLQRVFKAWGQTDMSPVRQLIGFLNEIRIAARRTLTGVFQFPDIVEFLTHNAENPVVQNAVGQLANEALPAQQPLLDENHPLPVWYELVRQSPGPFSPVPEQPGVVRSNILSPDPDEITVMGMMHGMMAEALPHLRTEYRRAYQRVGAEGVPLHIDRRWDATMADLVHTTIRQEISTIWEDLVTVLHGPSNRIDSSLRKLVHAFGRALDVTDVTAVSNMPSDLRLVVYKLRPHRLKLPPPSCAVLFVLSNRSAEELGEEALRAVAPLPLEESFVFMVNVGSRTDMDKIAEPLRNSMDFTVLPLSEADMKQLIGARQPTRALADLVLSRVNLVTVSPFQTRDPVPEHMFFGRERELAEVRGKLRLHSVALIAGRRIGKTSTLLRSKLLMEAPGSGYAPYFLDCSGVKKYTSLFYLINERWDINVPENASPVRYETVVNQIKARHPNQRIIFLFDEIDGLLRFDQNNGNGEALFKTFRSLSNENRCQYVFSGEKILLRARSDPYSALFNFTQEVQLRPLSQDVVYQLVAAPFEMLNIWMEEPDRIVKRVYNISAGHPNIVQMICEAMVAELDRDPESANLLRYKHLESAIQQFQLQEAIIETIWGQMSALARLVTMLWPEGTPAIALSDIEPLLGPLDLGAIPSERLKHTARDLELYCFVRRTNSGQLRLIPTELTEILANVTSDRDWWLDSLRKEYLNDPDDLLRYEERLGG
ncbi:MAG: hypothetical protein JXQ72_06750 [Anaerolineae bacterium]|nr:hypothetical protein [Anaerolineae bacterium]